MAKVVRMDQPVSALESTARHRFADHVQSIAFNLTLSRRMIGMLGAVRDYGFPIGSISERIDSPEGQRSVTARAIATIGNGANHFVGLMKALEARGLILHVPPPAEPFFSKSNYKHRLYRLTDAGKLVCSLLVEAGLLAAPPAARNKRA